jgi:hypothetical protein
LVYAANAALVVNHPVNSGTLVGLRWYAMRNTKSTVSARQQGA